MKRWPWVRRRHVLQNSLDTLTASVAELSANLIDIRREQQQLLSTITDTHQQLATVGEQNKPDLKRLQCAIEATRKLLEPDGSWKRLATDGPFFASDMDEARTPFLVPFDPDHEFLLWVADAFIPQASFGLLLPRDCAQLVPIDVPFERHSTPDNEALHHTGEPGEQRVPGEGDASASNLTSHGNLDHCLALVVSGRIAPQGWREAIHSLTNAERNGVWLVRFAERMGNDYASGVASSDNTEETPVHVMVTPRLPPEVKPEPLPQWDRENCEVLYFAGAPSEQWTYTFPKKSPPSR